MAEELAYPLCKIFNKSIEIGDIPKDWKIAEVKPIFKKGCKNSPGNYRPVSLTSIACKVLESFVRDYLYKHLINNELLSVEQFGFCSKRSTVTQLIVTLNDWMINLDNKIPVDAVYLDFAKAFDTVPHERLKNKLYGYGVRGNVLKWISSFLGDRNQYVSVNGKCSNKIKVTSGVPQGSVLGPTLFIYFINDLPEVSKCPIKIFADDTKAYSKVQSEEDRLLLQECIDALVEWSEKWLIKFNSSKCNVMHLGKNNPNYNYEIKENGIYKELNTTYNEKDLGVHIDPLLTFDNHIISTVNKARKVCGLLVRNIEFKSPYIMLSLFKSMVRPIIEYANCVWAPYKRKDIDFIEKVQRHFTKKIIGMKNLSYNERLTRLKLPSLEYRRLRGDIIQVYKIVNGDYDPLTTQSLFNITNYNTNNINTRQNNSTKLYKKRISTSLYHNFFTNRVINIWNSLPQEVVNVDTLSKLKNKIDCHYIDIMYSTNIK